MYLRKECVVHLFYTHKYMYVFITYIKNALKVLLLLFYIYIYTFTSIPLIPIKYIPNHQHTTQQHTNRKQKVLSKFQICY